MLRVCAQGVDERMINVHSSSSSYYYYGWTVDGRTERLTNKQADRIEQNCIVAINYGCDNDDQHLALLLDKNTILMRLMSKVNMVLNVHTNRKAY